MSNLALTKCQNGRGQEGGGQRLRVVTEPVSWKSRVYRGFSCTASIIGNADESPTS